MAKGLSIANADVAIYFTEEAKQKTYAGFAPGGLLFIGGSEMIMRSGEIDSRNTGTSMYQRAA